MPIVTTGHAAAELRRLGFQQTRSLATWSSQHFTKEGRSLRVTAMPARHAPLALTPFFPSVMGSMLEFTNSSNQVELRVYITGDTVEERVAYLAHGDVYEFRARERTDKAIAPRREPDVFVDGPGAR
ncbi:MAG TPA: hypothetical protein VK550_24065 [Polyangiaceae bacterium]|nr:hypothetical protein [Polyangiaceae bacterium]